MGVTELSNLVTHGEDSTMLLLGVLEDTEREFLGFSLSMYLVDRSPHFSGLIEKMTLGMTENTTGLDLRAVAFMR